MNGNVITQWRFRHGDRTLGPYPWPLLEQLYRRGSLAEGTPVQDASSGRWMTLAQALSAQQETAPAALPPPPEPAAAPPQALSAGTTSFVKNEARFRNCFLIAYVAPLLLLMVAFYWVIYSLRDDIDPRPWWLALTGITLLLLLYYCGGSLWLWIAGARQDSAAMRILSRDSMLILGLLLLLILVTNYRPLKALVAVATSPDPYGQFSIRVEDGGHSLLYTGALGYAAPAELMEQLRRNPAVDTLVIDSSGGWMAAGRGFVRVLQQRHIGIVVARRRCASACVLVFESAPLRVLEAGAALGFHSESNQISWAPNEHANDSFIDAFNARGVPQTFIDQAIGTTPGELLQPDVAELFRNHLIDRVRFGGQDLEANDYFLAVVDHYLADADLAPLTEGLRRFAPAHLDKLRHDIAGLLAQDAAGELIRAATARVIEGDERLALETAGNASQIERAAWLVDLLAEFRERAPELCYAVWTGQDAAAIGAGFTPLQRRSYLRLMGRMLASAAETPLPPPSDQDGAELMRKAVRPARQKYGMAVFDVAAARQSGRLSDTAVCDMAQMTFQQIRSMRPAEAGAAMRWLAHGNSPGWAAR